MRSSRASGREASEAAADRVRGAAVRRRGAMIDAAVSRVAEDAGARRSAAEDVKRHRLWTAHSVLFRRALAALILPPQAKKLHPTAMWAAHGLRTNVRTCVCPRLSTQSTVFPFPGIYSSHSRKETQNTWRPHPHPKPARRRQTPCAVMRCVLTLLAALALALAPSQIHAARTLKVTRQLAR